MAIQFHFPGGVRSHAATPGMSLLEIAREAGLWLDTKCGGRGVCKGCLVHLSEGCFTIGRHTFEVEDGDGFEARSFLSQLLSLFRVIPDVGVLKFELDFF